MLMDFEAPLKPRSRFLKSDKPEKDNFQRELESTLKKRNSNIFASNDFSDDDGLGMDDDFGPQPSSSKHERLLKTTPWQQDSMPRSPRSVRASMEPIHLSPRSGRSSTEALDKSPRSNFMASSSTWQPPPLTTNSSGSSPRKSPTAEQIIFGEKGTLGKKDYQKPSAPWSPPNYKKVNFQSSPREGAQRDEDGDSDGPPSLDLGRTARHGTMDVLMRSQRKTPSLEEDDEEDNLQLRRPSYMKKKAITDTTFGKTDNRRKSALLGLGPDKEEEENAPKGRSNYMKTRQKSGTRAEEMPQPSQRKFSERRTSPEAEARERRGSPSPTAQRKRSTARSPSPTKEATTEERSDSPNRRRSVMDFMKGSRPPSKETPEEDVPTPRVRRTSGREQPGSRESQRAEAASPKPLDFTTRERRRSPEREGSLLDFLSEPRANTEREEPSRRGQRSPSPVERKAPKPRARPTNDLLGQSTSMDRGVLKKQKVVEQSSVSTDSSSDEATKKHSKASKEPVSLPEPPKKTSKTVPEDQSSICEELERDPMSVAKDNYKKDEKRRQREKELEHQTDESKALFSAINAVADEQERESPSVTAPTAKKKLTSTGRFNVQPKVITRPTSALTLENGDDANFNDSQSLRQAVYDNWYREKMEKSKVKLLSEKKAQKEAEERKREEEKEKMAEKMATFNSWVDRKQSYFAEKVKEKKLEEKRKKEKEAEEREKERNAEKTFQRWKENKDQHIQEKLKDQRRQEHKKRTTEFEERKKKKEESVTAFESWKNKKDVKLKEQAQTQRKTSKETTKTKEEESKEKDEKALKAFEEWEKKQKERKSQMADIERKREDLAVNRRAWRPSSSNTVKRR